MRYLKVSSQLEGGYSDCHICLNIYFFLTLSQFHQKFLRKRLSKECLTEKLMVQSSQRHVQHLVRHLWWSSFAKVDVWQGQMFGRVLNMHLVAALNNFVKFSGKYLWWSPFLLSVLWKSWFEIPLKNTMENNNGSSNGRFHTSQLFMALSKNTWSVIQCLVNVPILYPLKTPEKQWL